MWRYKIFNWFEEGGPTIKIITIVHSFLLTVYSAWTFYNAFGIVSEVYGLYSQTGEGFISTFYTMCCDGTGTLWTKYDLGSWIWHFYISKFYEFIDTWIILLKGDKPMLLQTYHHAGVVLHYVVHGCHTQCEWGHDNHCIEFIYSYNHVHLLHFDGS